MGAEPLFRSALAIAEKSLGPDHPDTAGSLNNLAGLLESKGDYAGAEPLYRRALAIAEKVLGPNHPNTAMALDNLAGLLECEGRLCRRGALVPARPVHRGEGAGTGRPGHARDPREPGRLLKKKKGHR